MVDVIHLEKAPISEAILDVRVKFASPIDVEQLASFVSLLGDEFSEEGRQKQQRAEFTIDLGDGQSRKEVIQNQGYIFRSNDKLSAVQARLDGFGFSILKPYTNWGNMMARARTIWDRFVETYKPSAVTRVALRYINNLMLPGTPHEFSKYIRVLPRIPECLPQDANGFFTRFVVRDSNTNSIVIVNHVYDENIPVAENRHTVILDIDAMHELDCEPTSDAMWQKLGMLRGLKNRVFFGSITDDARRLYQ